jgi:DNA-binding NtrC family response regulator
MSSILPTPDPADPTRVLVIDDDAAFRFAMVKALTRRGFEVTQAESGEVALTMLNGAAPPDAALLDLRMRGVDGLEVLRSCRGTPTRIIVLTGHGSVEAAVDAMKLGAFSFLEKPVDAELLAPLLAQARAERPVAHEAGQSVEPPPIVGDSPAMDEVRRFVGRAGPSEETVALYGETGTGKEVVARHLHLRSKRSAGPFVALNAACVQRALFESELFGHKKGAFTGATTDHRGLFGEADRGTLFIDEVAELPLDSQAKLLRALETHTIRPVGASRELPVDVRIIAATNRDLWGEVRAGRFREDLYFRLQVLPILLPPLRQRPSDLPALSRHLLARIGAVGFELSPQAMELMSHYHWPGNVRELLNVLRRAVLFAEHASVDADLMRRMLAASVFGHAALQPASPAGPASAASPAAGGAPVLAPDPGRSSSQNLAEVERAHIARVLEETGGNVTRTATLLGIDRRTLQRKLKAFGLLP